MKIYSYLKFNIQGDLIEERSFEYSGPVCQCKGGDMPPPSEAEDELSRQQAELTKQEIEKLAVQNEMLRKLQPSIEAYFQGQIDLGKLQIESAKVLLPLQEELAKQGIDLNKLQIEALKDQVQLSKDLEPALLETIGFTKDASGKYVPLETPSDPIQAALRSRYEGAIAGTEKISPQLEAQLAERRKQIETELSQRLGPNWQETTTGIQAIAEFDRSAELLREEARQGMIQTAGSQYMAYTGQKASGLLATMGKTPPGTGGVPTAAGGGGASDGTSGLLNADYRSIMQSLQSLKSDLAGERIGRWSAEQGQAAGRTAAMMGGATTGAMVGGYAAAGTSVGGPYGALIGAGIGLLAGYLLS